MNRRTRLATRILPALTLPALAWAWAADRQALHRSGPDAPEPGLTRRQALDRTGALCRVLEPGIVSFRMTAQARTLRLTADPLLPARLVGTRRIWQVDCEDPAGEYVASMVWNRDTGDLLSIGHRLETAGLRSDQPRMDRVQAVRAAARAMRELGIARQASRWRLASAPTQGRWNSTWCVCWQAPDRRAMLLLDAVMGELKLIRVDRLRVSAGRMARSPAIPAPAPPSGLSASL